MNFSKKIALFLRLLFIVLMLTGCWDRKEVNDLALVTAGGVDRNSDGSIELSVLIFIPKGKSNQQGVEGSGGGGTVQTIVRSAKGKTIADAMSKLQEKLPRHIFWGHCKILIFDQELARDGIAPQVDFILRHPQLRENAQLFVSEQKTKEILSLIPPLERDLSEVLRELGALKIGIEVTAKDFSQMLISESEAGAIPWIKILPPEQEEEEKQTIAYINGTAIFKNGKMVGQIDNSVTRGAIWLKNEVELATITVKPKVKGGGYVSMSILRANTKLIPKIENGKWKIKLHAVADTEIIQNTTNLDMASPMVVKPLERQLNNQIKNKVNKTLDQVQKDMKADIFGFANAFHRKYPKEWAKQKYRWNEIFPSLEVTIDSEIKIRRQGMNSVLSKNP